MLTTHNQRRLKFFMDLGHPECGTAIEDCGPEYYCFEDVTNVQCQRQQNLARDLVFFIEVDTFVIVMLHAPLCIPASSALVADDMTFLMCAMFSTAPLFGGMVVSRSVPRLCCVFCLAGNVANMPATCWPDSQMSTHLADMLLSWRNKMDPDTTFLCR